jgi:hypothetical protein
MKDVYRSIYEKLDRIGVFSVNQYTVIERPPDLPLCIDRLAGDVYALSQNPVIDGVVVADPDMEVRVFHRNRTAEPLSFQDRSGRRAVYPGAGRVDLKTKNELAEFLDTWLSDLLSKGYIRSQ